MAESRERARLAVLFAGVLMAALDIAIVGPALPAVRSDFGVSGRWLPWVFSVYVLFYLIGTPLLAKRSDRRGRRRTFIESLVLFACGSLLVAGAWSFPALLVGRAIQAFGAGGFLPVAGAVIAETVPLERRGRTLGLIGAVFGVAFLLGPLLGALLLPYSWRVLFLINVPAAGILSVLAVRLLPQTRNAVVREFDVAGALLLSTVLAALVIGVGLVDTVNLEASLASPWIWLCSAVVTGGSLGLFYVERRATDPVVPPRLVERPQLRLVGAIALAVGAAEAGVVFLPDMVVLNFHLDAARASLTLLPLVLTLAVGAPLAGLLLDRAGSQIVIQLGLALTMIGLLMLALARFDWANFYLAGGLVGLGLSALLGAPLRYLALQEVGEQERAVGQGMLTLCVSIGQIVGAAAIGVLVGSNAEALGGYRQSFLVVGMVCAGALVLSTALRSRVTDAAVRGA